MLRLIVWVMLAVLAGTAFVYLFQDERGYVLISWKGWAYERNFARFLVEAVIVFAALSFLLWLLRRLFRLPRRLRMNLAKRRVRRARRHLTRGLIHIAEGRWRAGEKLLTRGATASEVPLINYLSAARAAQLLRAVERRDRWLKLAYETTPEAMVAVLLTQAELQLSDGETEQALATLERLAEEAPDHSYALVLRARLYQQLQDWSALHELLPRLRKVSEIPRERLAQLQRQTYLALLRRGGEASELEALWRELDKELRADPEILGAYATSLSISGDAEGAEKLLRGLMKRRFEPALTLVYADLPLGDGSTQLKRIEAWLRSHGDSPEALLAAGKLCVRRELWGKARSYLEASIASGPRADAYAELAHLLEQLGDLEGARAAYRAGLAAALGQATRPLLPSSS